MSKIEVKNGNLKRYYFDVVTDYGSVIAESEAEAEINIREMIDKLGVDFEIYEISD